MSNSAHVKPKIRSPDKAEQLTINFPRLCLCEVLHSSRQAEGVKMASYVHASSGRNWFKIKPLDSKKTFYDVKFCYLGIDQSFPWTQWTGTVNKAKVWPLRALQTQPIFSKTLGIRIPGTHPETSYSSVLIQVFVCSCDYTHVFRRVRVNNDEVLEKLANKIERT